MTESVFGLFGRSLTGLLLELDRFTVNLAPLLEGRVKPFEVGVGNHVSVALRDQHPCLLERVDDRGSNTSRLHTFYDAVLRQLRRLIKNRVIMTRRPAIIGISRDTVPSLSRTQMKPLSIQQRLYFAPLPQGQESFLEILTRSFIRLQSWAGLCWAKTFNRWENLPVFDNLRVVVQKTSTAKAWNRGILIGGSTTMAACPRCGWDYPVGSGNQCYNCFRGGKEHKRAGKQLSGGVFISGAFD